MNVVELLDSLASWSTLLLAIIVYGFAPGFLLRLIVLAYERDDPRRGELIAELYAVPRLKRPFWVAEQLEKALFGGLSLRIKRAATGRIILRRCLESGVLAGTVFANGYGIYRTLADLFPTDQGLMFLSRSRSRLVSFS
ncbi:MAG: hypothetical protein ACRDTA_07770 [Pseudonocardiaceae bacterium]